MRADDIVRLPGDRFVALKLAIPGMISGALSWALIDSADKLDLNFQFEGFGLLLLPVSIYPGLVFGLILGAVLHLWAKVSLLRAIGYVFAAGLSYFCAFHVAFYIMGNGFSSAETLVAYIAGGIPGGLAGSLLLGLLTKLLLQVPGRLVLRIPVAVGTIAGALLGLYCLLRPLARRLWGQSRAAAARQRARTRPSAHRFLKAGGRFSAKALMPSF
jgi:hypothetical protein